MCPCVSVCVCGCICMREHLQEFLVSQSLSFSCFLLVSVILFSLHFFLHIVTPLHCVAHAGLVSHRGSDGFSPSLSPEDASISY